MNFNKNIADSEREIQVIDLEQRKININLRIQEEIKQKMKTKQVVVNHDSAIYWYRNGKTKVVNDYELAESVKLRGIDPFWSEIYCIQTIVQSKIGLGKPIYVNFVAPINKESPETLIKYDYK